MNIADSDSANNADIAGSDSDISDGDKNADSFSDFAGTAVISRPGQSQGLLYKHCCH